MNIKEYKLVRINKHVTMREAIDQAEPILKETENAMIVFDNKFVFKQPESKKMNYLPIEGDTDPNYKNSQGWKVITTNGMVTIHPSIKVTMHDLGIEHFWITKNKVIWCGDSYIFKSKHFTKTIIYEEWYPSNFKEIIETGVIYRSIKHNSISWLCPCGCGITETIKIGSHTDLGGRVWEFDFDEDYQMSVSPSIYRRNCEKAHYWIKENRVVWV